jgi:hypothetical protein
MLAMNQGAISFMHYLLGIGVAIVVFLIKEGISYARSGIRFRKRLLYDIKMMVEGHYHHLPVLSRQGEKLSSALDDLRAGAKPDIAMAPIWDSEFNLLAEIYQNSSHLNHDVFQDVVRFYDSVGRLGAIRKSYNEMLEKVVMCKPFTMEMLNYLDSCLTTLESNYREMIGRGCNALILLSAKHWFLRVDISYYRDMLAQIAS